MQYDFGGYATRNNLRCSDGRTILQDAFKECDGQVVPLVWNHNHDSASNVLGHALLENRSDGVYTYGVFNDTEAGQEAKQLVAHGDVTALSIYANKLEQRPSADGGRDVVHGVIREVSLVLAGANPGASIDTIAFEHSDGSVEDEGIIYSGEYFSRNVEKIEHACGEDPDKKKKELEHAKDEDKPEEEEVVEEKTETTKTEEEAPVGNENTQETSAKGGEKTVQDVYDSMTDEQKTVVDYLVGVAVQEAIGEGPDDDDNDEMQQSFNGGYDNMNHNVFEGSAMETGEYISHSDKMAIFNEVMHDARAMNSFRESLLAHAEAYGITNIDVLFPDAQNVRNTPDFIKRETKWVNEVMTGTKHAPFSRIRSTAADITEDEARAKGYVKGTKKVDEVITVAKRETTPQTIYKKQKLDKDDILDITDFDVIAWLWQEMRIMLDEEIARAILIGDGRLNSANDKIKEDNVRPILTDDDLFSIKVTLSEEATQDYDIMVEEISLSNEDYEGSGEPIFFTTPRIHGKMLWARDAQGRRIYMSDDELCSALMVKKIVEVPVMKNLVATYDGTKYDIYGIKVNLADYTTGTDRGGDVSQYEDFDIDYNQQKFLLETRMSGALTLPHSAQVYRYPKANF